MSAMDSIRATASRTEGQCRLYAAAVLQALYMLPDAMREQHLRDLIEDLAEEPRCPGDLLRSLRLTLAADARA